MEIITITNIIIFYLILILTHFLKIISDKIVFSTYKPLIDDALIDAVHYASNITQVKLRDFQSCDESIKDNFIQHAIGYIQTNWNEPFKKIDIDNNNKLCSLLISNIEQQK